jgi:hypothetical protein
MTTTVGKICADVEIASLAILGSAPEEARSSIAMTAKVKWAHQYLDLQPHLCKGYRCIVRYFHPIHEVVLIT